VLVTAFDQTESDCTPAALAVASASDTYAAGRIEHAFPGTNDHIPDDPGEDSVTTSSRAASDVED
jgi:hypothetical protein